MARKKCLILDVIHPDAVALLKEHFDTTEIEKISSQELAGIIGDFDAVMMRVRPNITKEVLDNAKKLKIIGIGSIGTDHVDLKYAAEKGIKVCNIPGGNSDSVAEMTIGHIIYLLRQAQPAVNDVKKGIWDRARYESHELKDKTVGLVALGAIGKRVAGFLRAFGATVLAYDPYISPEEATKIGVVTVSLNELLSKADIVSVHAPLTPDTRHLISTPQFELMKKGSYIINMSRGGVVDEESLYEALVSKKLAGAAFDVMEIEPCMESPLYSLDNFLITPHFAGVTVEAQQRIGLLAARKILEEVK